MALCSAKSTDLEITTTGFLFYLIADKLHYPSTKSLHFFHGKYRWAQSLFRHKIIFFNYNFQGTNQTVCFNVKEWDLKPCILEYHNHYAKYVPTLICKSCGENKNFGNICIYFFVFNSTLSFASETEIFENIKGFGWVNIEWRELSGKNLKDLTGMQPRYINIFWTVPSYPWSWRHNCIKWNFIQNLGRCSELVCLHFCFFSKTLSENEVSVDKWAQF